MTTLAEIKSAIEELPPAELSELLAWVEEYQAKLGVSAAMFAMDDEDEEK